MHVAVRIGGRQRFAQFTPRLDGLRQTVAPTRAALTHALQLVPIIVFE
jgi:hypothetical protein